MAAIVVVGLYFRFASIGFFPSVDGFASIEETQRGTGARLILELGARPWEWPPSQYVAAAAFSVFGYSIHALRGPTTLLGALTVVPFYLLVRELTAAPAALFATGLLAVARWHVQVSWYNEDVYVPLFFFVTVLYLLLRTRREPRPLCIVLLGACCGYTLYDYAGFRMTPVLRLAFLARGVLQCAQIDGAKIRPIDLAAKLLFPKWKLESGEREFTVMRVSIEGAEQGQAVRYDYHLLDRFDEGRGISSMARTTGYTCTAVARLLLQKEFTRKGVCPPEYLGAEDGCLEKLLQYFEARHIRYRVEKRGR